MLRLMLAAVAAILVLAACEPTQPCDDYVAYMCECHADEEGFDCAELQRIYGDAEPAVQSECTTLLDEQQEEDAEAGLDCPTDTADTGA